MHTAKDPFLSWRMLSAAHATSSQPPTALTRYSFFQARNAIYHGLDLLGIEKTGRVLLPTYLCRAAVDPFLAYGLDVDFYRVNRDCTIDFADLERRLTPGTRAVLAVHYFGFPQPLHKLRRICTENGIALIEDCAHVLTGEAEGEPLGSVGDISVFSWRKFLPIFDGADLVLNVPSRPAQFRYTNESFLFTMKALVNMVEIGLIHTQHPALRLASAGIHSAGNVFRKVGGRHLKKRGMIQADVTAVTFDRQNLNWPMSRFSLWTKRRSAIPDIVQRRRHNYMLLYSELPRSSNITPLYGMLPDGICPWVFPAIFPNIPDPHLLLRKRGTPAVTWGGVRHPALKPGEDCNADFLFEKLVFLPIHQCLTDNDIKRVARDVRQLLDE